MKVKLNEERTIKGKLCAEGDVVIVRKDEGQDMIDAGAADLVIEVEGSRAISAPENRVVFSNHTRFWR